MKRILTPAAFSLLAGLSLLAAAPVRAQVAFQITNDTLSGGDPNFPVVTALTFQNLVLTQRAGGASTPIAMYDPFHTASTTLDTGGSDLESDPFALPAGGFQNVTLTGTLNQTSFQAQFAPGGYVGAYGRYANLFADFNNTIPAGNAAYFALGTLSLFDVSTGNVTQSARIYAVPEAGGWALAFGPVILLAGLRRRVRR